MHGIYFKLGVIFLFIMILASLVPATAGVVLREAKSEYLLSEQLDYYEDSDGTTSFEEILSGVKPFRPGMRKSLNFGFTGSAYWFRLTVTDASGNRKENDWLLQFDYPLLDHVDLYIPEAGRYREIKGGDAIPFSAREIPNRDFLFSLVTIPGQDSIIYFRVQTTSSMKVNPVLMTRSHFIAKNQDAVLSFGIYYGILLIMAFYNFFLFVIVRDRAYLVYVLYVIPFILFRSSMDGLSTQYLWGDSIYWGNTSVTFFAALTTLFGGLFVVKFLDTKRNLPGLHRVFLFLLTLCMFDAAASLFIPYKISIQAVGALMAVLCTLALVAGYFSLRKGYRPARFFLIAWATLLVSNIVFDLGTFGVIQASALTEKGMYLGSLLEVVLLSFALGDRINVMKREKEEAQRQAIENLHRTDKLKDEFLANTSHELRTPLNGIIGLAEALMDGAAGALPAKAASSLSMISTSGRRLSNLVNDILDYSKLRHREIELRRRAIDLKPVADAVLEISRPLVGDKHLELVNAIAPAACIVDADEDRVEQILLNLVGNAIKFTSAGNVIISAAGKGDLVEVSVRDTGIGIPESAHERIFESFEQLDGSISRTYGGTGLGLSLTRQLVELHGGTIGLRSNPGEGATFSFTLPAAGPNTGSQEMPAALRRETLRKGISLPENGRPEPSNDAGAYFNILAGKGDYDRSLVHIVDDDPVNLQVLEDQLSIHNYDVVRSADGAGALDAISSGRVPDLLLIDVMMPGMSGYEVAAQLRKEYALFDLPIMMLTAKNRVDDMMAGFAAGANDYLTKPFNKNELLARVKTLVKLKNAVSENRRLLAIDREFEVARTILQTAIPEGVPVLSRIDIAVKYIPMESVGGDYYDFHIIDENKIGVFISDVSGHGVSAALIASMVKIAFSSAKGFAESPVELLTAMNLMLIGNLGSHFLTAAYFYLDLEKHTLKYARTGHEPLIVYKRKTKEFIKHLPRGRAMGIVPESNQELLELAVEPGDRIILYTDGIIEAMNTRGEMYGSRRFMELVIQNGTVDTQEITELILMQMFQWTGRSKSLDDDFSLVVVDIK